MTKPCPDDLAAFKHEPADYEAVTVEQCDRDAAAWAFTIPGPGGDRLRDHFARAFARHRTQANETMREAIAGEDLLADAQCTARLTAQVHIWNAMKEAGYEPTPEAVKVIRAAAFAGLRNALSGDSA